MSICIKDNIQNMSHRLYRGLLLLLCPEQCKALPYDR